MSKLIKSWLRDPGRLFSERDMNVAADYIDHLERQCDAMEMQRDMARANFDKLLQTVRNQEAQIRDQRQQLTACAQALNGKAPNIAVTGGSEKD